MSSDPSVSLDVNEAGRAKHRFLVWVSRRRPDFETGRVLDLNQSY